MKEINNEIKQVIKLMQGDIDDGTYIAMDKAKEERWNNRPTCCGSKVDAFQDGSYICWRCDTVYEG